MKSFCLPALVALAACAAPAFAAVTVTSPAPNSTVTSPVTYTASATSSTCSKGVAGMGIYVDNKLIYTHHAPNLDTTIALSPGSYHTVVQEWDYCGTSSWTTVPITVSSGGGGGGSGTTGVTVLTPAPNSTVTSPVTYQATATTSTCSKGVAAMGIYVDNKLIYTHHAPNLDTQISMSPGTQHTVVQEWDYCGASSWTTINLTVAASQEPTVGITSSPASVASGGASTLTVTATNATTVTVTGSGNSWTLPATGGTITVNPTQTTTYTAEASSASGNASSSTTVDVVSSTGLDSIDHVILMLQENHSFDNYFGMLNPYRQENGWNIGADGRDYEVDGIDDKLGKIGNVDDEGTSYPLFKLSTTCIDDMSSAWLASFGDVTRYDRAVDRPIRMDGFVHNAEGYAKSCVNSGSCSGSFTDTTGHRAMGYYDQTYLNYYYYMASQFAVSDRWFSPVASKSIDNRIATFTGGTTQGLVYDPGGNDGLGWLSIPTIFQKLQAADVSWRIYYTVTDGYCLAGNQCSGGVNGNFPDTNLNAFSYVHQWLYKNPSGAACTGTTQPSSTVGDMSNSFCIDTNHIAPMTQYYTDLASNKLAAFTFIESGSGINDEHPGSAQSILNGQSEVAKVIDAFMTSPEWSSSVFFFSYDEGGGPYDHVPPVPGHSNDFTDATVGSTPISSIPDIAQIAVNPDNYKPCTFSGSPTLHCDLRSTDPGSDPTDVVAQQGFAAQIGFRVPNMVISPFTRKHYVSHTPMDHTAIIKFVEDRFLGNSAYMTNRDKAQPNLLDFFDFTNVPWATPPTPPAPVTPASLGYNPCHAGTL